MKIAGLGYVLLPLIAQRLSSITYTASVPSLLREWFSPIPTVYFRERSSSYTTLLASPSSDAYVWKESLHMRRPAPCSPRGPTCVQEACSLCPSAPWDLQGRPSHGQAYAGQHPRVGQIMGFNIWKPWEQIQNIFSNILLYQKNWRCYFDWCLSYLWSLSWFRSLGDLSRGAPTPISLHSLSCSNLVCQKQALLC